MKALTLLLLITLFCSCSILQSVPDIQLNDSEVCSLDGYMSGGYTTTKMSAFNLKGGVAYGSGSSKSCIKPTTPYEECLVKNTGVYALRVYFYNKERVDKHRRGRKGLADDLINARKVLPIYCKDRLSV